MIEEIEEFNFSEDDDQMDMDALLANPQTNRDTFVDAPNKYKLSSDD